MIEVDCARVKFVRRSSGESIQPCHRDARRGYATRIMFWGCISVFGPGCLIPITGTMKSTDYIDVLQTHLLPIAQAWYGDALWLLQQDNASCHTSGFSLQHINDMGIRLLSWPSNSPDMNCIENAWQVLKRKLYQQGTGRTRNEVIIHAQHIWSHDDEFRQVGINLVNSMPRRVRALYNVWGGPTNY
jgi:hypothetical protein